MAQTLAIIVAAGQGRRAGKGVPKPYRIVDGEMVLRKCLKRFLFHRDIDEVQVIISSDHQELYEDAVKDLSLTKAVIGGESRADSVRAGLDQHNGFDYVLIHDVARPFLSDQLISSVVAALSDHEGVIPAIPVADALWKHEGEQLVRPMSRHNLVAAQTPQGFHFGPYKAIATGGASLDDAESARIAGLSVVWILGEKENRKLTYPEDFL